MTITNKCKYCGTPYEGWDDSYPREACDVCLEAEVQKREKDERDTAEDREPL